MLKDVVDIEICYYIKDFICIFVNLLVLYNINLFKVEL